MKRPRTAASAPSTTTNAMIEGSGSCMCAAPTAGVSRLDRGLARPEPRDPSPAYLSPPAFLNAAMSAALTATATSAGFDPALGQAIFTAGASGRARSRDLRRLLFAAARPQPARQAAESLLLRLLGGLRRGARRARRPGFDGRDFGGRYGLEGDGRWCSARRPWRSR